RIARPGGAVQGEGHGPAGIAHEDVVRPDMSPGAKMQGFGPVGGTVRTYGVRLEDGSVGPEDGVGVVLETGAPVLAAFLRLSDAIEVDGDEGPAAIAVAVVVTEAVTVDDAEIGLEHDSLAQGSIRRIDEHAGLVGVHRDGLELQAGQRDLAAAGGPDPRT